MLLTLPLTKSTEEMIRPLTGTELAYIQNILGSSSLSALRNLSIGELMSAFRFTQAEAYRICILLDRDIMLTHLLEECSIRDIDVVSPYDPQYPSRLKQRLGTWSAPPLFFFGDLSMLSSPSVGINGCTGIKTPDAFKESLKTLVPGLADNGVSLITSGDPGAAYHSRVFALNSQLPLITVCNGGMAKLCSDEDRAINAANRLELIISPFNPFSEFSTDNQAAVNRIVYSQSVAAFTVTVPAKNSEYEAVRKKYCPYLYAFDTPENAQLISRGFSPVSEITDEWLSSKLPVWLTSETEQLSFL